MCLPLVLPTAPTETRRRSGIISRPTTTSSRDISKDGATIGHNEFMDMTFRGEIYTMGGWGLRVQKQESAIGLGNMAVNFNG